MASTTAVVIEKTIYTGLCIEIKRYMSACVGQGITGSGKRLGKTPLRQLRYQDKKAQENCRWKLNCNFSGGDLFLTLCFPPYKPVARETVRKSINTFLDTLRRIYRRNGKKLQYVYTVGMTKKGMAHIHMVLNKFDTDTITKCWQKIAGIPKSPKQEEKSPRVTIRHLDYSGEYRKLAEYLIKNSREQFYSSNKVHSKRFCASKGLKMPLVTKRILQKNRFWLETPKPLPNYYIDPNSVYDTYGWADNGGEFACCRVQGYTMYRIDGMYKKTRKTKYRQTMRTDDAPEVIEKFELEVT